MLQALRDRGFVHQVTDEPTFVRAAPTHAYIGFDLTADCLHVGSLTQLMFLRHWIRLGGKATVLLGSATSRIGDPSGKSEARPMLTDVRVNENQLAIERIVRRIVPEASVVTNDWHDRHDHLAFLRIYGPHFNMARMLSMESVKGRLAAEQSMTFLEFNYMTLQAIDFRHLKQTRDVSVQVGGSDQWGNIVMGIELHRKMKGENYRMPDDEQLFGITTPLLLNKDGTKMGKTEKGAVWIDPGRINRDDYWHFWRNTRDEQVALFLGLFTECDQDTIEGAKATDGAGLNPFKTMLADQATDIVFGGSSRTKTG